MTDFWSRFYNAVANPPDAQQLGPPQPGTPTQLPSANPNTAPLPTPQTNPNLDSLRQSMLNSSNPVTGAYNNIYNWSLHPHLPAWLKTAGQQASDAAAIEGGNPAVAQPVKSGLNPAPTLPQPDVSPRAQAPVRPPVATAPPGTSISGVGGQGQQPYGSPWDPQGAGYAAAQRLAAQQGGRPPAGPMAAFAQQPSGPFGMIMSPNASAVGGGRGSGTAPLGTALDLSGYQPGPPPAPPSYNMGYGGGGRTPAMAPPAAAIPPHMRAQVPKNPFTGWNFGTASPLKGNPWNVVPGNPYPFTGGGI